MSFGARIRSLASDAAIYGLAKVLARFLTFFLNPFYTHALAVGEYGLVLTLYGYIALVLVLYPLGLDAAFLRFAAKDEARDEQVVFSTTTWFLAAVAALLSAGIALLATPIATLTGLEGAASWVTMAAGIMFLDSLAALPLAWLRLRRQPRAYAAITVASLLANVGLNILFLLHFRHGGAGVLEANLASSALTLVLLLPIFERLLRPRFDRRLLAEMLRFGLPLVPAALAAMVVNAADRPLLTWLVGSRAAGLYGANYRLGMLMMLLVTMFLFAWQPFYLERGRDPDARPLFARILTYYLSAAMAVFLAVSLTVDWIVRIPLPGRRTLFDPSYFEGVTVVPWVLLGYVAYGVYVNLSAGPTLAKQTSVFAWVTGLAALVNVGANLALIPRFGYRAAGWTTFLAYTVMAAGMWLISRRLFAVDYEWPRLARVAGTGLGIWALHVALGGAANGALTRLALLAAYPLVLLAPGYLEPGERAAIRRWLGRGSKTRP